MSTKLGVLAIDDDAGDAELLRRSLQDVEDWKVVFHHASSLDAALPHLASPEIDFVFLDYMLGKDTGLSVLGAMRESGDIRPVVVLTGQGDEGTAATMMRRGADDYIAKDQLSAESLRRSIHSACAQYIRRKAEKKNRQLLEELQVAKVTLEIQNRRLAELYETAHRFVDHVSHEFRTPLTVVREFATIIRDELAGPVGDEQREYLDIIVGRVDDLAALVDDMLDISKLEADLLGLHRAPASVSAIVERLKPILTRRAAASKVSLTTDIDADLPLVFCDAEKVGRVIINLAINALKFCGESGTVELRARHAPGSAEVMVSVVDSGAGIAQDDVHRIFERFRQASASPQSGIKGFGLGLSIVKELVQLNLGSIDVDSTLGQGSTFSFTLPVADPHSVIRRYLDRVESLRGAVDRVAICTVEHVSGRPADAARVIGRLAHRCDLLFPVESGRSLLVVAGCGDSESDLVARLTQTAKDASASLSDEGVDIRIQSVGAWTFPENADEICVAFESLTKQRGETACLASVTS